MSCSQQFNRARITSATYLRTREQRDIRRQVGEVYHNRTRRNPTMVRTTEDNTYSEEELCCLPIMPRFQAGASVLPAPAIALPSIRDRQKHIGWGEYVSISDMPRGQP
ncbi:hypothetical protein M8818_005085 [Zalaria obscura]|uniref:Uncharacterized protein n=1 Tax=Zalaria obscura TaxID=2024903 RepID=A0ACC3SBH8_9PEZI